ncbi:MAG: uncharacterized protein QOH86_1523 [Sphingomonadales bacterium]|jgi:uncharacterized protein (DUF4415 family)/uncharacterized DUF497 family protein|nr:uncharacterized protein [Sphingomonadales bacterium]
MRWTWDPDKAAANRKKHGVSFELAVIALDDPLQLSTPDPHGDDDRWRTLALVGQVCLFIVHTLPEGEMRKDGSSAPGGPPHGKEEPMKKNIEAELPAHLREEAERLAAMRDEDIDFSDAPEMTDWSGGERGKFYRPRKQQLTLRLDADVVQWFKERAQGRGYQTRINEALRNYVHDQERKTG